jgi:hypothetical protein
MKRIDIPAAKLAVVFPAGQLPGIDPDNPQCMLRLGAVEIFVHINAKAARKLQTHAHGAVLQGRLISRGGGLVLDSAGFRFLEPKPQAEAATEGGEK